jgi:hypothetical protein
VQPTLVWVIPTEIQALLDLYLLENYDILKTTTTTTMKRWNAGHGLMTGFVTTDSSESMVLKVINIFRAERVLTFRFCIHTTYAEEIINIDFAD